MIEILLAFAAATVHPSDFAWTARLPPSVSGGLRWVVWTDSVYILSQRADQSDVALFTDDGKLVPWAEPNLRDQGSRIFELALQPVPPREAPPSPKDTAIVPQRWIGELPRTDRQMWTASARLDFGPGDGRPFVAEVDLETSSDLSSWVRVGGGGICRVGTDDRGIVRDSLSVSGNLGRYVRVSAVSNSHLELERLVVSVEHDSLFAAPAVRGLREVEGTAGADAWDYDLGGDYPVNRLSLALPPESALEARILARTSLDTNWAEIDQTSLYRTEVAGKRLSTPPLVLAGTPYRFWRIVPTSTTLSRPPRMRAEWALRRHLFLAGPGQGIRLAVGSRRVSDPQPGRSEALFSAMSGSSERGLHLAPEVTPSGFVRQGTGAPDAVSSHGRWVLALLVVAALSTLGFAWKVWKESTQAPRS